MPLLLFLPFQIIPYLPLCTTHHALLPFLSFDLSTAVLLILTSAFLSLIRFHSFLSSFLLHASTFLYVFLLSFSSKRCLFFHSKYSFYFFSLAVSDQICFFCFLTSNQYLLLLSSLARLFDRSLVRSLAHSFLRSFVYSFVYFFSFKKYPAHLFIHSFIRSCIKSNKQSINQSIN